MAQFGELKRDWSLMNSTILNAYQHPIMYTVHWCQYRQFFYEKLNKYWKTTQKYIKALTSKTFKPVITHTNHTHKHSKINLHQIHKPQEPLV